MELYKECVISNLISEGGRTHEDTTFLHLQNNHLFWYNRYVSFSELGQTFFYFSSFKNPDRMFSRIGIKIYICIADRMKNAPNL